MMSLRNTSQLLSLSLTWSSPMRMDWLASKPRDPLLLPAQPWDPAVVHITTPSVFPWILELGLRSSHLESEHFAN